MDAVDRIRLQAFLRPKPVRRKQMLPDGLRQHPERWIIEIKQGMRLKWAADGQAGHGLCRSVKRGSKRCCSAPELSRGRGDAGPSILLLSQMLGSEGRCVCRIR